MKIVCLDLEGVLFPEIWIAFARKTGIDDFLKTTRDEPNYDKLMAERIELLKKHNLKLEDIQDVISTIEPLKGAKEFIKILRDRTQLVILSDTFSEFALPLMRQLDYPTIFCNSLEIDDYGFIKNHIMRIQDGKKHAVDAFHRLNFKVFAAGDSYNDITMIDGADDGSLFCPPERIKMERPDLKVAYDYDTLLGYIFNH